jgi:Tfp pilus assembly protein PilN
MLRTNLSTRPFYNQRIVRLVLAALGAVLALTLAYEVQQAVVLSREQSQVRRQAASDEEKSKELRASANRLQASISQVELERVQAAAAEANGVIDGRTFSWTALLNHIESTLPPGVMLTAIRPSVGEDGITVSMTVIGQGVTEIGAFMDGLESKGSFTDVLSTAEQTRDDGRLQAVVTGRYLGGVGPGLLQKFHRAAARGR